MGVVSQVLSAVPAHLAQFVILGRCLDHLNILGSLRPLAEDRNL